CGESLIDVASDVRVERDHLADLHRISFVIAGVAKQSSLRSFFCGLLASQRFPRRRKRLRLPSYYGIVLTLFLEIRSWIRPSWVLSSSRCWSAVLLAGLPAAARPWAPGRPSTV